MRCYRVVESRFCNENDLFNGKGAEGGGRWNPPGMRTIYTAENIQICSAEKGYYSISQKIEELQGVLETTAAVPAHFYEQVQSASLCAASIEVNTDVQILDFNSTTEWEAILK